MSSEVTQDSIWKSGVINFLTHMQIFEKEKGSSSQLLNTLSNVGKNESMYELKTSYVESWTMMLHSTAVMSRGFCLKTRFLVTRC